MGLTQGLQPYLQPVKEKELSCFPLEQKKQVKFLAEVVAKDKGVIRLTTKNRRLMGGPGDSCRGKRPLPFKRKIQQPKDEWKPAVQR